MRTRLAVGLVAVLAVVSACAPKTTPVASPGPPQFPDYVQPTAPPGLTTSVIARQSELAWRFLQAGDLRSADRETTAALKTQPDFAPAQATAAYIALARRDATGAVALFTRVVDAHPDYVSALVGKGLALVATEQTALAAEAFRAALKADPSLIDIGRRVDVLTLKGLQDELAVAREAARRDQPDAAMRAYRNAMAASPDSAFLYRELAAIERQQGLASSAIEHLRRANGLDATDAASFALLGDLLEQQDDVAGALQAYADAVRLEPDAVIDAKVVALRGRLELATLPGPYRAIGNSAQVTRAELAALVGVRLTALVQTARVGDIGVITDIRGHWAERWIAPVARAGILEAFPNHTFLPRAAVSRVDLAQAASRLLNLIAAAQPAVAREWAGVRGRFTDLNAGHLAYPAASMAVAAAVMQPTADGAFQPTRAVSGREAIAAIERLHVLAAAVSTPASASAPDRR